MNLKPPAPLNSPIGALWMAVFVILVIVAYRKFAPAKVQKSVTV